MGMRFNGLTIPPGAIITNAFIQFQVDETHSGVANLVIEGEATDSALSFTSANGNISSRVLTGAAVGWTPAPWTTVGEARSDQRTPDVTSIIQEIVDRSGWSNGNSLAVIISGTGQRVAESFNGDSTAAPLLHVEFTTGNEINQAPTVDSGSNQTINLSDSVFLGGTITDDGQPDPPGTITSTWSQVSGSGNVTFSDTNSEDTTASFDLAGTYVLRLTADDSDLTAFDEIIITVNPATTSTTIETRISTSSDDAEEDTTTGSVNRGSSDLELVDSGSRNQLVGMRFNSLTIPPGAIITNASIQFQVDEAHSGIASLMIEGEATDSALTFTSANGNITSRVLTGASVDWTPVPWITIGEAGEDQRTPDISLIIQEIVDRPGWSTGNSLAVIISGTGQRVAESINGDAAAAPLLHVEYQ